MQQREQTDPAPHEPVDPDVDLHLARPTRHLADDAAVLAVIAVGGAIGATARYLIGLAWPTPAGAFPWATLVINIAGSALIGVLMVLVTDVWTRQRLLRPFLGTGILGGFTTFSTFSVQVVLDTDGLGHMPILGLHGVKNGRARGSTEAVGARLQHDPRIRKRTDASRRLDADLWADRGAH